MFPEGCFKCSEVQFYGFKKVNSVFHDLIAMEVFVTEKTRFFLNRNHITNQQSHSRVGFIFFSF